MFSIECVLYRMCSLTIECDDMTCDIRINRNTVDYRVSSLAVEYVLLLQSDDVAGDKDRWNDSR